MADSIKITENELAEVRMIQEKFQQKLYQLGQLFLQKKQLETSVKNLAEQETKTWEEWTNLQKMENELMDKLLKKYGEGSLDVVSGTLKPTS